MKIFVVYDSKYGNTESIARAVASEVGDPSEVTTAHVDSVEQNQIQGIDLLIVGSPTQAWRTTDSVRRFIKSIDAQPQGRTAAAFDTGFESRFSGSAARGIQRQLSRKGFMMPASPIRFYVEGMEGPLREGEIERAKQWGRQLREAIEEQVSGRAA